MSFADVARDLKLTDLWLQSCSSGVGADVDWLGDHAISLHLEPGAVETVVLHATVPTIGCFNVGRYSLSVEAKDDVSTWTFSHRPSIPSYVVVESSLV